MASRKAAIINVSMGLLNVSLATLAAVGSATGNPLLAGATVLPQAVAAGGVLEPLLKKQQHEPLIIPIPSWWTQEPLSQSWQVVCSNIETRLPEIIKGVEQRLHKETNYPSSSLIKQIFAEQVALQLSSWEIQQQDRAMVAGYVTPLLLAKTAGILQQAIDEVKDNVLATWLEHTADALDRIQKSTAGVTVPPAAQASSATGASQSIPSAQTLLEQKRQHNAYDIYICYHDVDEKEVMIIGDKLKAKGILPWFDVLEAKPGTLEKSQQEQQILKIPAAAICVGSHEIVDKQALQMYSFIEQFLDRGIPVIPVLLTNAPMSLKLPPYLGNFSRVDFRRSAPDPLGQLVWGITGTRP